MTELQSQVMALIRIPTVAHNDDPEEIRHAGQKSFIFASSELLLCADLVSKAQELT
jgi:hypothetical protein